VSYFHSYSFSILTNLLSISKGLRIAAYAISKRHSSTNNVNSKSSQSHCIFQIELVSLTPNMDTKETSSKCLSLVDLAGTERSLCTGLAGHINNSLMILMRCLRLQVISDSQSKSNVGVVPFRDSKLTHFLIDHLSGLSNSSTRMIVDVLAADDYDKIQHILVSFCLCLWNMFLILFNSISLTLVWLEQSKLALMFAT